MIENRLTSLLESRYVQWTFVLSCVAMSAVVVIKPTPVPLFNNVLTIVSLIGNVLAFAIAYYITFHKQILKHIFLGNSAIQLPVLFVALVFTLVAVGFQVPHFLYHLQTQVGVIPSTVRKSAQWSLYR